MTQEATHPDEFQELATFTGETVWYNAITHVYTDQNGNKLVSGSEYAESMMPEFPLEMLSNKVARKHGVPAETIRAMWEMNATISKTFGNALHYAMEQYFRHKKFGTAKQYHLPKPVYLREAVESFPWAEMNVLPEVAISDVAARRVGRVDGLLVEEGGWGQPCVIIDFKSDAEVEKNLERHQHQLNFYRAILEGRGMPVQSMVIWNYVRSWTKHTISRIDVKEVK